MEIYDILKEILPNQVKSTNDYSFVFSPFQ